jgi:hypothetical protein
MLLGATFSLAKPTDQMAYQWPADGYQFHLITHVQSKGAQRSANRAWMYSSTIITYRYETLAECKRERKTLNSDSMLRSIVPLNFMLLEWDITACQPNAVRA